MGTQHGHWLSEHLGMGEGLAAVPVLLMCVSVDLVDESSGNCEVPGQL